jgi:hypothetical protein
MTSIRKPQKYNVQFARDMSQTTKPLSLIGLGQRAQSLSGNSEE